MLRLSDAGPGARRVVAIGRHPKPSTLAELRHLARTKSSQFTFGGDIIVPFTFQTMACFLNISMARRVAGSSIADSGI